MLMPLRTKKEQYEDLTDKLAPLWERDAWLMEHAQIRWRWARGVDEWLVKHRDDDMITPEEYQTKCTHLLKMYESMGELV